jgi:hypothetical protein
LILINDTYVIAARWMSRVIDARKLRQLYSYPREGRELFASRIYR